MSNSPHEWYLRIEAVNLDHSVYDTNDISTIRGGSSLLLDAVYKLAESIELLEKISVGASTGLYRINAQEAEIQGIEQAVKNFLQSDPYCHFATFVVATDKKKAVESIVDVNNRLMAKCAWQQYLTSSFSFPKYVDTNNVCSMGGTRPAVHKIKDIKAEVVVSESVNARRTKGKELRQKLYERCFDGAFPEMTFTDDLETLAQNGDIAVIHFDGNRFGNIRNYCRDVGDLKKFDSTVQGIQKNALKQIIEFANDKKNKQFRTTDDLICLETLLWGGDEIELVVPATEAWATLKRFFDATDTDHFKTAGKEFTLTWSAGVVFCRHNLPILQIRRYAEQLCSLAKQPLSDKPVDKFSIETDNRIAYLNMSSFDLIERNVESFIPHYHQPAKTEDFTLSIGELQKNHNAMLTITRSFPKNKVYDIVGLLQKGEPIDDEVSRALKMAESSTRSTLEAAIKVVVGENKNRWLLIGDLWNLIGTQAL
jgi:hypothetical protein